MLICFSVFVKKRRVQCFHNSHNGLQCFGFEIFAFESGEQRKSAGWTNAPTGGKNAVTGGTTAATGGTTAAIGKTTGGTTGGETGGETGGATGGKWRACETN